MNPKRKILLNPGPATTSDSVKMAQVVSDICPREKEFAMLVESVKTDLKKIASSNPEDYETILISGSGTAAMEAALTSVAHNEEKTLIINNGAYGERFVNIAKAFNISFIELKLPNNKAIDIKKVEECLNKENISCVVCVHHETTTGILNPIFDIGNIVAQKKCKFIVDAMSSYAGLELKMEENNIDFLISSSNKCIQGMPGISFVICKKEPLEETKNNVVRSFYLNLYKEYEHFKKNFQSRFTLPVQCIYALRKAIDEYYEEGGRERQERYERNWKTLVSGVEKLGFILPFKNEPQSKILFSILEPENQEYSFTKLHDLLYEKGFTIYPGKVSSSETFRLSIIGDLNLEDVELFLISLKESLVEMGISELIYRDYFNKS